MNESNNMLKRIPRQVAEGIFDMELFKKRLSEMPDSENYIPIIKSLDDTLRQIRGMFLDNTSFFKSNNL